MFEDTKEVIRTVYQRKRKCHCQYRGVGTIQYNTIQYNTIQ